MPSQKKAFRNKSKLAKKEAIRKRIEEEEEDELEMYMKEGNEEDLDEFVPPEDEDLDEFDETMEYGEEDFAELDGFNEDDLIDQGEAEFDEQGDFDEDEEQGEYGQDEEEFEEERIIIDNAKLKMVIQGVNKNSKQALKMFLKIFRGIILQGISEDNDDDKKKRKIRISYEVESGKVYNKVIMYALTKIPHVIKRYIEQVVSFKMINMNFIGRFKTKRNWINKERIDIMQ